MIKYIMLFSLLDKTGLSSIYNLIGLIKYTKGSRSEDYVTLLKINTEGNLAYMLSASDETNNLHLLYHKQWRKK